MSLCQTALAEEQGDAEVDLPTIKFFYYDSANIEWVFSAEPERLRQHLATHPESQSLLETATNAAFSTPEANEAADQMTRWIEQERKRFEQSRREVVRLRMAEGIIAYLRAHDFNVSNLVEALKRRSGASGVELVAVHLVDEKGTPSYKLKVVLIDSDVDVGKQGFNVRLRSPNASYSAVTYALGVALYELQETIHGADSEENAEGREEVLPLPAPESLSGPDLAPGESSILRK
ncbi:MAG: hypothetical protein MI725_11935 [Pirellulales bacterium]|nr:hypothetical protein [Pirellulales bacterium]